MFLVRYFVDSFKFKTILITKDKTIPKTIIFFILMVIIATFPMVLESVREDGQRLDFLIEDFRNNEINNWELPEDFEIKGGKLVTNNSDKVYQNTYKEITYIINYQGTIDYNLNKNSIILQESTITYIDRKGYYMIGHGYRGFTDVFSFKEFQFGSAEERTLKFENFANNMEKSFDRQIVLFSILTKLIVQMLTNILYVIILSFLVQLYKFGYEKFLSYKDGLKFVMLAIGPSALFSFAIGFLAPAFSPVVFQITSGIIVMLIPLIFGKRLYS